MNETRQWISASSLDFLPHVIFSIDGSIGVQGGSGVGNNHPCINLRTRSHSHHYFLHTFPSAAALALPFPLLLWQRGTEGTLIPGAPGV